LAITVALARGREQKYQSGTFFSAKSITGNFLMTTEPTRAYFAKLDAGFTTALLSIERTSIPPTGFRFGGKYSNARRAFARLREDISCPPLLA
jgi:hypothetical protein